VLLTLVLAGCGGASPTERSETDRVKVGNHRMATGPAGAERLAGLVQGYLSANDARSARPNVVCEVFDEVSAGVRVPCAIWYGRSGSTIPLRVEFQDGRGTFRVGP
jgi:hypothetical protein